MSSSAVNEPDGTLLVGPKVSKIHTNKYLKNYTVIIILIKIMDTVNFVMLEQFSLSLSMCMVIWKQLMNKSLADQVNKAK